MNRVFLALIIAGAFVAGSVFAGTTVAFAIPDKTLDSECAKQKHDGLLALLCESVMELQDATDNVDDADSDPTNELQSLNTYLVTGSPTTISDFGGGFVFSPDCTTGVAVSMTLDSDISGVSYADIKKTDSDPETGFNAYVNNPTASDATVTAKTLCVELT